MNRERMKKKDKHLAARQIQPHPLAQEGKRSATQRGQPNDAVRGTAARLRFLLNRKRHSWAAAAEAKR